jgi:hypothetical protein
MEFKPKSLIFLEYVFIADPISLISFGKFTSFLKRGQNLRFITRVKYFPYRLKEIQYDKLENTKEDLNH